MTKRRSVTTRRSRYATIRGMDKRALRIGVDTGGTFTDLVLDPGEDKPLVTYKLLSTPDDPARAVLEGLSAILKKASEANKGDFTMVHGSTVATNALLEGKGAKAAFVTTKGFEDTLWIGRQNRPQLYALEPVKPEPPLAREAALGTDERVLYDGSVLKPLAGADEESAERMPRKINIIVNWFEELKQRSPVQ